MCIHHYCEKYTVSVNSRGRAVALIVPVICTLFAANFHHPCLHVTLHFLSNEHYKSHIIFSLLV